MGDERTLFGLIWLKSNSRQSGEQGQAASQRPQDQSHGGRYGRGLAQLGDELGEDRIAHQLGEPLALVEVRERLPSGRLDHVVAGGEPELSSAAFRESVPVLPKPAPMTSIAAVAPP